ncbi:hypothetical protein E3J79_02270 [Candidatus Dependentiae bacterium]|nr:MAG: hypothetical protein E3J79_02270 [Candidatus Dependentiae bacterium]
MIKITKRLIVKIFILGIGISFIFYPLESENLIKSVSKGVARIVKRVILGDNFYTVDLHMLYRSRQLSVERLNKYIEQYNIKTIINLRRKKEDEESKQEQKVAEKNNVLLFNVPMDARIITPLSKLKQLLAIFLTAPTPMFVHCYAGSDRTGEACAFYKLIQGGTTKEALTQLSLWYGHSEYVFPKKRELIKNLDTIYPNIISNMKVLCPINRFTVQELQGIDAEELVTKLEAKQVTHL